MNWKIDEISIKKFYETIHNKETYSCIGHKDLAKILHLEYNRSSVKARDGDYLLVAQLSNGRLPEGATTLPDDVNLKFYCVTVTKTNNNTDITIKEE